MIDLNPKICNICGGKVIYTSNSLIYGREYGSGRMYYCTNIHCGAYVGTHIPRPKEAFGILADEEMRELKKKCHELFDQKWINEKRVDKRSKLRKQAYREMAAALHIPENECHFGYFDKEMLYKAYGILKAS